MRAAFYSAFLVLSACVHPVFAADAGACYTIASPDARALCLAKARGEPSTCYSIQDGGLRAQCLAEVRG